MPRVITTEYRVRSDTEGKPVLIQSDTGNIMRQRFELRSTVVWAISLNWARAIQREYIKENGLPNPRRR